MDSNDKLYGILAYLGILVLVPLLAGKTEFTRYHSNQGLVLFIIWLIPAAFIGIVCAIISVIPFVGGPIAALVGGVLGGIISLAALIFAVLGIVNVINEKTEPLPVIGGIKILK